MANLCIIPARGGSKRIPKKNIKNFLGKPIIGYSIEAAWKSSIFAEVMVSTDSWEVAELAKNLGASVPFLRSGANSDDYATTFDVIEEVITEYSKLGKFFESICCLYPCAPLVNAENLNNAFQKLGPNVDSVIPVVPFSFPIQRAFKIEGRYIRYINPEHEKTRSQDLDTAYQDAGQFYFFKGKSILQKNTLVPERTSYIELDEIEVQDIDNEMDWKIAELKYQISRQ